MNKTKPKKPTGRPPRHGAYSLMVKAGELPKRRTYLRAYLNEVRASLIADLGPKEADLTAAQRVLINGVISKLSIIRCIEEHVKENGVFRGRELSSVLAKSYITYTNSLRLDLLALGVNVRKGEEILDLGQYMAARDAETTTQTPSREIEDGEIVKPSPSSDHKQSTHNGEKPKETGERSGSGEDVGHV